MKRSILFSAIVLSISITSCNNEDQVKNETSKVESNSTKEMKSHISLFEIPVTDLSRAVDFYQSILNISIEKMEMPLMEMGIFPYEEQMVTGVLMKGEGYTPSSVGVTIYLNGGDNLQTILDKVEENGGKVIVPKTAHADESGYFAMFFDTEGNKLGLNSPH